MFELRAAARLNEGLMMSRGLNDLRTEREAIRSGRWRQEGKTKQQCTCQVETELWSNLLVNSVGAFLGGLGT